MRWANFFHIYQPADQQPDILEAVVTQSYRPILTHLKENKRVRLTLNVTGALLDLFDRHRYHDLIDDLRIMGSEGRVEFTGSAKYHALLPFLDTDEIIRQISINDATNRFFLGKAYQPSGFFPPEMAYSEELVPILESLGFSWVIIDEIAYAAGNKQCDYTKLYRIAGSKLLAFFRERHLSNLIMSAVVRSPETLREAIRDDLASSRYIITAMDGETFGHHRPGLEQFLFKLFSAADFDFVQLSDLQRFYRTTINITPIRSTWASSNEDIEHGVQFLSWSDPENIIHQWQWELVKLTLKEVRKMNHRHPRYQFIRNKMDVALASDHFWWASAKPWWSVEMIEDGAYRLLDTIRSIPDVPWEHLVRASQLYEKIVSTAFRWQRSGKIREMTRKQRSILRIPFKDRTISKGGAERGVFHAFIAMMQRLEREATKRQEYEKAILWRDAIYKLKNKLDIYDSLNAIDLLRVELPHDEIERTIKRYKARYRKIRGGQPEQRGS